MNVKQQSGTRTSVERIGYSLLDSLRIAYSPQHLLFGKFCVDAFLSAQNIVIQFDGDYWHGHPTKYPAPDQRQQKRIHLDRSQDAYLAACGIRVIRLWEIDLKTDPQGISDSLREQLLPPNT